MNMHIALNIEFEDDMAYVRVIGGEDVWWGGGRVPRSWWRWGGGVPHSFIFPESRDREKIQC